MPIPAFDQETGYLPAGLHRASLAEIRQVLGFTVRRMELIAGLEWAAGRLFAAGVRDLRIDGSFVTAKPFPGDIDGFWVAEVGVRYDAIPPILMDFSLVRDPGGREPKFPMWFAMGVELFVHPQMRGDAQHDLPHFFSHSRDGVPRGYVQVVPA
jgi:hypothetical protein